MSFDTGSLLYNILVKMTGSGKDGVGENKSSHLRDKGQPGEMVRWVKRRMTGWGPPGSCSAGGTLGHSVGEVQHGGAGWGTLYTCKFFSKKNFEPSPCVFSRSADCPPTFHLGDEHIPLTFQSEASLLTPLVSPGKRSSPAPDVRSRGLPPTRHAPVRIPALYSHFERPHCFGSSYCFPLSTLSIHCSIVHLST